jgi:hypothetical protein
VDDLGAPVAYQRLDTGVPVFSADGERVGRVAHVLADPGLDVFDGLVIDAASGGHRFVDASEVGDIHERGVVLRIDATGVGSLPAPTANPAALGVTADTAESPLAGKLRRAWDLISGDY